jgi:hypothetical protein
MLSISADAKTVKGQKLGFLTGILYLAPADLAGYGNICPFAIKANCISACLFTAGRGGFTNVQNARLAKTAMYFEENTIFFNNLAKSIRHLVARALRLNLVPVVRLNGTSDIEWENKSLTFDGNRYGNIMEMFPDVQFYDYTKIPTRKNLPANYDLTFSYSGVATFQDVWHQARSNPSFKRFAVVFDTVANIPKIFEGFKVISGDDSDIRHIEPSNVIVALYAKGKARKDMTGFVVRGPSARMTSQ